MTVDEAKQILLRLAEFENKTWDQILGSGSHLIETSKVCKAAQERLAVIQRDDLDELMSFRVEGAGRVWCIKTGALMRILWWDPRHQVYPVSKDRADRTKGGRK